MSTVEELQSVLQSLGLDALAPIDAERLSQYVELLIRWNARMNLTAIRDRQTILRRHLAESIQCARSIPSGVQTLLDYGSGGGFPGVPCAVCRPDLAVTLAESQGKKAAFLREVVRSLGLMVTVHHGRVEDMRGDRHFDAVTLRAVDGMQVACQVAVSRLRPGGWLVILTTESAYKDLTDGIKAVSWQAMEKLAGGEQQVLLLGTTVP